MRALIITIFFATLTCAACNQTHQKVDSDKQIITDKNERAGEEKPKKYQVKSGIITYETRLITASVNLSYKTILYFDDYGSKECRDTYDSIHLRESFMSDGKWLYQLSHQKKIAYRTGKNINGTEQKFDWNRVSQQDKDSGRAIKLPNVIIAGRDCEVYQVNANIATARYAGWNNILMLSEISSPGGSSTFQAIKVQMVLPPAEKFLIPEGYHLKKR